MPQAFVAPRAGARAAAIIARRARRRSREVLQEADDGAPGAAPVAVVMATLTMQIRGTGRESIRARTSRQQCGTALVLGVPRSQRLRKR